MNLIYGNTLSHQAEAKVNHLERNVNYLSQLCPILCDPMDGSMPGFPVHHQILELAQTHAH